MCAATSFVAIQSINKIVLIIQSNIQYNRSCRRPNARASIQCIPTCLYNILIRLVRKHKRKLREKRINVKFNSRKQKGELQEAVGGNRFNIPFKKKKKGVSFPFFFFRILFKKKGNFYAGLSLLSCKKFISLFPSLFLINLIISFSI